MDIKGFGVIHPQCPSSIVEIILMEIDKLYIANNHFEKIDISIFINNLISDQPWRPSEKNINQDIEKEECDNH